MEMQFKCPCGAVLKTTDDKVDSKVTCTQCGRMLVVPRVPVAVGVDERDQEEEDLQVADEAPTVEELEARAEAKPAMSGMAVASLVLGLVGPFLGLMAVAAGVLALIFGGVALRTIAKSPFVRGKGTAIAGIVLGVIDILLGLTFIVAIYGSDKADDSLNVVLTIASAASSLNHLFWSCISSII